MISRRHLLSLSAAGLLLPRHVRAAPPASSDHKFLIIFCAGGWDPTFVFAPTFGNDRIDVDPGNQPGSVNGIDYVDADERPEVRTFLQTYGDRTCFVNGFEVRSVTHERCRRILMTGGSQAVADDWGAIVGGSSTGLLLPHLVLSGPAYSSAYTNSVVRLGSGGQLGDLVDGRCLSDASDVPLVGLSDPANALVDARVRARAAARLGTAGRGREAKLLDDYLTSLDQTASLASLVGELDLSFTNTSGTDFLLVRDRVKPALTCFERGYARSAIVQHDGVYDTQWDSHSFLAAQNDHFELLFQDLNAIMADMDGRVGTTGARLSDEVTIVVVSEMGRTPQLNATGGKDHWTYTSAMFIGGRTRGGQVVGGYDDDFVGRPADLASGDVSDTGTPLTSAHVGATLLAMADLDPLEFGTTPAIDAVIA